MERIIEQSISDVLPEYLQLTDGPVYARAWRSSRESTMIMQNRPSLKFGTDFLDILHPRLQDRVSPKMSKCLHDINEGGQNLILFYLEKVFYSRFLQSLMIYRGKQDLP